MPRRICLWHGKTNKATTDTTTYPYDAEDRLVKITTPTDVIQYLYDGLGRRNVRTLNGVVTRYVYDREDILFEFDENDRIKARYTHVPGIDEPLSVDRDTDGDGILDVTYYYHYDGLGSVTAMTDSAGNVVQTYVYDTFGNIVQQTGSVENVYTYTGREWDAEASLYYYRARYYDPTLGRFINGDPIGFAGGDVNFYVYVQNNPVNYYDPYGLWFFDFNITVSTGAGAAVSFGLQIGSSGIYGYGGAGVGAGEGASITLNRGDPCLGTSVQGVLSGGTGVFGGKVSRSGSLDNNTDVVDLENNIGLGWGVGAGAALTVTETISILPF